MVAEGKKKEDGEEDEEEAPKEDGEEDFEEVDEELDEGTDYANAYFDNGENYLDEDDNIDDEPVYWVSKVGSQKVNYLSCMNKLEEILIGIVISMQFSKQKTKDPSSWCKKSWEIQHLKKNRLRRMSPSGLQSLWANQLRKDLFQVVKANCSQPFIRSLVAHAPDGF